MESASVTIPAWIRRRDSGQTRRTAARDWRRPRGWLRGGLGRCVPPLRPGGTRNDSAEPVLRRMGRRRRSRPDAASSLLAAGGGHDGSDAVRVRLTKEFQVPVVVEFILERVTNISMGTEIDDIVEFEELAEKQRGRADGDRAAGLRRTSHADAFPPTCRCSSPSRLPRPLRCRRERRLPGVEYVGPYDLSRRWSRRG